MNEQKRFTNWQRRLAALPAFAVAALLFWICNLLAADVRYPLAIFCLILSGIALLTGIYLLSTKVALFIGRVVGFFVELLWF